MVKSATKEAAKMNETSDPIPLAFANPPKSEGHWAAVFARVPRLDARRLRLLPRDVVPSDIAKEFHQYRRSRSLSLTLALAFRPVGAFIFGLMADRYGRRLPLMIDLIFYSIVEVATGFAPNYTTFLVLRSLFGIGMGGEWGVGASLAMEKVPPQVARRSLRLASGRLRPRLSWPHCATAGLCHNGVGGPCSSSAASRPARRLCSSAA